MLQDNFIFVHDPNEIKYIKVCRFSPSHLETAAQCSESHSVSAQMNLKKGSDKNFGQIPAVATLSHFLPWQCSDV